MQYRQRYIDDTKPFHVIKDIEKEKKISSQDKLEVIEKIESDLQKVLYAFDTKKKIQIPKSLLIQNNNLNNNDKNDKKNNNKKTNGLNFTLTEYKRPDSYIIYSSQERNQSKIKDYEAKSPDYLFLEYHGEFMKIDVLEKIISALENSIGKGEKIPDEMAKKIIEENFSKYKSKSDIIIKYFNDRRSELKKSLLRKYWRLQKSSDKYFTTTFRRRERDKMKIRKNNQKKEESYEKVKLAGDLCKTHLLSIIDSMTKKEHLNKKLACIENIMFLSQISNMQKHTIPKEVINENNEIINYLTNNGINLKEIGPPLPPPEEKKKIDDEDIEYRPVKVTLTKKETKKIEEDLISNNDKLNLQELIIPQIDFSSLYNDNNNKNDDNNSKNYFIQNKNNKYRVRIRLNRNDKISVDRYIQNKNSMNPFDDSFNENIFSYQKYNPNMNLKLNANYFEDLLKEYYQQKYKYLEYIMDYNDDYESFFKNKKNNKRLLSKKRVYK